MPSDVVQIVRDYRTCEFTTLNNGSPQTWPVSPGSPGTGGALFFRPRAGRTPAHYVRPADSPPNGGLLGWVPTHQ